jgi:hypothetical protein
MLWRPPALSALFAAYGGCSIRSPTQYMLISTFGYGVATVPRNPFSVVIICSTARRTS